MSQDNLRSADERTAEQLRSAMTARVAGHEFDPDSLTAPRARPERPLRFTAGLGIAAACLVVAGAAVGVGVLHGGQGSDSVPASGGSPRATTSATAPHRSASACAHAVATTALPDWARSGFSADAVVQPHVTGAGGRIVGVLFTNPLRVHQQDGRANKVLWVVSDAETTGALTIRARLEGSNEIVDRTVAGGPGPSTLDLPRSGCWLLTLRWSRLITTTGTPSHWMDVSQRTDTVALPYAS